jgi:hypothetical protein
VNVEVGSHKAGISQQFLAQNGMRMATHLPYSPNLALSDFYLFGHVKGLLRGESFEMREDHLSVILVIQVILASLEKSILSKVFLEWMTRPE